MLDQLRGVSKEVRALSLAAGKGTSFAARAGRVSGYAMGRRMGRGAVGDGEGSRGGVMLIAWQRVMAA